MKTILLTFLTIFSLGLSSAHACSVMPVDEVAQTNDLAAQALTRLNVNIANVDKVNVSDYYGNYIWTPMCPKGLVSGAQFVILFTVEGGDGMLPTSCAATVKVDKNYLYENGRPDYKIELPQPATCLAN